MTSRYEALDTVEVLEVDERLALLINAHPDPSPPTRLNGEPSRSLTRFPGHLP
jgi:hypothetical protein